MKYHCTLYQIEDDGHRPAEVFTDRQDAINEMMRRTGGFWFVGDVHGHTDTWDGHNQKWLDGDFAHLSPLGIAAALAGDHIQHH